MKAKLLKKKLILLMVSVLAAGTLCAPSVQAEENTAEEIDTEEKSAEEDPPVPLGLERFLALIRESDNPYLGYELFEHALVSYLHNHEQDALQDGKITDSEEAGQMDPEAQTETASAEETDTETQPDTEEAEEETQAAGDTEAQSDLTAESGEKKTFDNLIFVGDSRVVGMSGVGGYCYIGLQSIGYSWFTSEGTYMMQDMMAKYPDAAVVLCFGVNDPGNIGAYIDYYQTLIDNFPDTSFFMMSVNPVDETQARSCGYSITNGVIEEFNSILKEAFPDRYLDCYTYLDQSGFGSGDGVHYDAGTYMLIQEYAKFMINFM